MSENPPPEEMNQGLQLFSMLIPAVIAAILGILSRPFDEKLKIDRQRKNILEGLRFKIAIEVAKILPEKTVDDKPDDYVLVCRERLKEYFSSNSNLIIDLINSEKIYSSYVKFFKLFKYGFVGIPILVIVIGIVLFLRKMLTTNLCLVGVLLSLLLIAGLWFLMEIRKDKFSDLCTKYEIVNDD